MIIMLIVTIIVFFILRAFVGTWIALFLSILFHIAWWLFNYRAGIIGLIKSNLRAYFTARSRGLTEDEALAWVIHSRYPMSEQKRLEVENLSSSKESLDSEEERVKSLVFIIFCYEQGTPPTFEFTQKILAKIHKAYQSMSRKHSMSSKTEQVIKSIEGHYLKLKETNPGMDEHWFLANSWLQRYKSTQEAKKKGPGLMNFIAYKDTHQFSILDPPKSIRALALFIVYKELSKEAEKYSLEFSEIMEPVIESQQNNTFLLIYKKKNPKTWKKAQKKEDPDFEGAPLNLYWFIRGLESQHEDPEEAKKILKEAFPEDVDEE